jgi:Cu(I)/Ag(I) efflux system protein CusF
MHIRIDAVAAATLLLSVTAQAVPSTKILPPPRPEAPVQLVHEGHGGAAKATGVVNSVDVAHRTINLSHKPISAFGWPAMTMDFPVADDVDLTQIRPGTGVDATLVREGGGARVDTLHPAGTP